MASKLEKVLRGLEECLNKENLCKSDNLDHGNCPYRNIEHGCIVRLHEDAYEVLRNLTDQEVCNE